MAISIAALAHAILTVFIRIAPSSTLRAVSASPPVGGRKRHSVSKAASISICYGRSTLFSIDNMEPVRSDIADRFAEMR